MHPHVSIIIPVHNAEPFLARCLDSAAAQTEPEVEIICVDDASTDASPAMLDARAREDKRFRVVHRENNGGESVARNQGVAMAHGEYLAFLDHDDELEPDACRELYDAAVRTDADIVRGKAKTFHYDGHQTVTSDQCFNNILNISKFYFWDEWWSAIYRTSLIKNKIKFIENFPLGGDSLFQVQALIASNKINLIENIVYHHYRYEKSGNSKILSVDKVQSTNSIILRIIESLNKCNTYIYDKNGYNYLAFKFVTICINRYKRCMDYKSRLSCCETIISIRNLHKHIDELYSMISTYNRRILNYISKHRLVNCIRNGDLFGLYNYLYKDYRISIIKTKQLQQGQ